MGPPPSHLGGRCEANQEGPEARGFNSPTLPALPVIDTTSPTAAFHPSSNKHTYRIEEQSGRTTPSAPRTPNICRSCNQTTTRTVRLEPTLHIPDRCIAGSWVAERLHHSEPKGSNPPTCIWAPCTAVVPHFAQSASSIAIDPKPPGSCQLVTSALLPLANFSSRLVAESNKIVCLST